MSNRARRRTLKSARLRAVVCAGLDGLLERAESVEEFNRELHEAFRDLADQAEEDRTGPPPFDPLTDDLFGLRPDDESRTEWREIRPDFERAERIIEDARAILPRLKNPLAFRATVTEFPARIHRTARALMYRTGVALQYGPRGYGRTWAEAARMIHEVPDKRDGSCAVAMGRDPKDCPELLALVRAAIAEAQRRVTNAARKRTRVRPPVFMNYEGRRYEIVKTSLDRLLIRDCRTGAIVASSWFNAI